MVHVGDIYNMEEYNDVHMTLPKLIHSREVLCAVYLLSMHYELNEIICVNIYGSNVAWRRKRWPSCITGADVSLVSTISRFDYELVFVIILYIRTKWK